MGLRTKKDTEPRLSAWGVLALLVLETGHTRADTLVDMGAYPVYTRTLFRDPW